MDDPKSVTMAELCEVYPAYVVKMLRYLEQHKAATRADVERLLSDWDDDRIIGAWLTVSGTERITDLFWECLCGMRTEGEG